MIRVFVYGTLLRDEPNHVLLEAARFDGPDVTEARFSLFDLGGFPAMVRGGDTAVHGELYVVDGPTLERLDRLEGHPHFYRRAQVPLASGTKAVAYLLRREQVDGAGQIPGGRWRARDR